MNQPIAFFFNSQTVTTFCNEQGEMWFLAKDVCEILGYQNPRRTVSLHCKGGV